MNIVEEFQRGIEAYMPYLHRLPEHSAWLEWLALIQHHGGPTRLLDFTRSIYIAAFFAFDDVGDGDRGIWAVDTTALNRGLRARRDTTLGTEALFDREFSAASDDYIALIACPSRLNQRIGVQQGTFLCALSATHTLEDNLFGMLQIDPQRSGEGFRVVDLSWTDRDMLFLIESSPVIKFVVDNAIAAEVLMELGQMNIKHASLFPGLDGYARDLKRQAFWFSAGAAGAMSYAEARTTRDA